MYLACRMGQRGKTDDAVTRDPALPFGCLFYMYHGFIKEHPVRPGYHPDQHRPHGNRDCPLFLEKGIGIVQNQ